MKKSKINIIYLKEFIKSGKFGTLTLGSTKDDVITLLGNKFAHGDFGETQILKYDGYEFFYDTQTNLIFGIQNDHLQADCLNHKDMINIPCKNHKLDNWILQVGRNITFSEIRQALSSENIDYIIEKSSFMNDEKVIRCTKSRVKFDFCNEYTHVELDEKGKYKSTKEVIEDNQDNFVLNGIRLFSEL